MKYFFPFFKFHQNLHYFDSAATTIKPHVVIDAMTIAYTKYTMPIGKSVYKEAEKYYEKLVIPLKLKLKHIFYAQNYEIFFGHSVTILLSQIIILCIEKIVKNNKKIKVLFPETVHNSFIIPLQKYNNIKMHQYNESNFKEFLNTDEFDIIYLPTIDHITGKEFQDYDLLEYKKKHSKVIIIADASQSVMYQNEDLSNQLFDFFVFSSHKMYGPEGLAILFLSKKFMKEQDYVFSQLTLFNLRNFFSQGSLPYTAFYGFVVALKFLEQHIYTNHEYKKQQSLLLSQIYEQIKQNSNLILLSPSNTKTIITFYHKNKHAHDIAIAFSSNDICVRSGDLCSPFIQTENNNGFVRISMGCYVEKNDIEKIKKAILQI